MFAQAQAQVHEKLSQELRNSNIFKAVEIEKKKIAFVDDRRFRKERDALDDYSRYMRHVHNLSNAELKPFFTFLNRCTMKLAEIDILSKRALSRANRYTGHLSHLRFLDLCGGPGGFAEYLLMIHKWECRGLGVTLKKPGLDYQLDRFHSNAPTETFVSLTAWKPSLSGDLFDPQVQEAIRECMMKFYPHQEEMKFDLVLADGAVGDDSPQQEENGIPLQIRQVEEGARWLALKGTLKLKCFDITLPSTLRLLTVLKLMFQKVTCTKPRLSRKGNSERYVLCQGYRPVDFDFALYIRTGTWKGSEPKEMDLTSFWNGIQTHMMQTWMVQRNTLRLILKNCSGDSSKSKEDVFKEQGQDQGNGQGELAPFWARWQLVWYHGLTRVARFDLPLDSQKKENTEELRIALYDDWHTMSSQDARYLREIKVPSGQVLLCVTQGRVMDHKGSDLSTSYPAFCPYPSNTLLLCSTETKKICSIVALPKYPKLFLQTTKKELIEKWRLFNRSLRWWMNRKE